MKEKRTEDNDQQGLEPPLYAVVVTRDMDHVLEFYQSLLNLKIHERGSSTNHKTHWVFLSSPAGICLQLIQLGGVNVQQALPWKMERVGLTHFAFGVTELDGLYSRLSGQGIEFNSSPQPIQAGPHRGGRTVYLSAPDRVTLEFIDSPLIKKEIEDLGGR